MINRNGIPFSYGCSIDSLLSRGHLMAEARLCLVASVFHFARSIAVRL
jgi:hypothetical protein